MLESLACILRNSSPSVTKLDLVRKPKLENITKGKIRTVKKMPKQIQPQMHFSAFGILYPYFFPKAPSPLFLAKNISD